MGPFGTNCNRFANSWLEPRAGPDPGQYGRNLVVVQKQEKKKYDLQIEGRSQASTRALTAAEKERTKAHSIFASGTDRFKTYDKMAGIAPSNRTERLRDTTSNPLKSDVGSAKNQTQQFKSSHDFTRASDKVMYDFKDSRTQWTAKGRATDYEVFSGKNIGFDKTSPRFNYNQVFYG